MEWSDEECLEAWKRSGAVGHGIAGMNAALTYGVELVAARGGTMTPDALADRMSEVPSQAWVDEVMGHIAALGARNAALDAELATERRLHEGTRVMHREAMRVHESDKEAIRRRSLEAGNLERLIAEHGLPAAMRWVVDGEEPVPTVLLRCMSCAEDRLHLLGATAWRCSTCGQASSAERYPCSPTCTHPDAATPGHPERVKERSEAFMRRAENHYESIEEAVAAGEERGAEAMRAACLEAVQERLRLLGIGPEDMVWGDCKYAIESVAP